MSESTFTLGQAEGNTVGNIIGTFLSGTNDAYTKGFDRGHKTGSSAALLYGLRIIEGFFQKFQMNPDSALYDLEVDRVEITRQLEIIRQELNSNV